MSEEQLKAFLEKVKGDTSLQDKLKAASDVDAVVAIAKEAGFSISADDLKKAQSEISEEELEVVAGGKDWKEWQMERATPVPFGPLVWSLALGCQSTIARPFLC